MVAKLTVAEVDNVLASMGWTRLGVFRDRVTPFVCRHDPCGRDQMVRMDRIVTARNRGTSGCRHCKRPRSDGIGAQEAEAFVRNLGFVPLGPYPGQDIPWKLLHSCGAVQTTTTFHYLHSKRRVGTGCRSCASRDKGQKMALPHQVAARAISVVGVIPLEPYPAFMGSPWKVQCAYCGHRGTWSYHSLTSKFQKWRCPGCKILGQEARDKQTAEDHGWTPIGPYPGPNEKWAMRHRCGFSHSLRVGDLGRYGEGCPACASSGFKSSAPEWLYVMEFPEAYKVGVSNNFVQRKRQHLAHGALRVLYARGPLPGSDARSAEKEIIASWRLKGHGPAPSMVGIDGETETISKKDISWEEILADLNVRFPPDAPRPPSVSLESLEAVLVQDGAPVRGLVSAGHYTGSCPSGRFYVELWSGAALVGGAVFSTPSYPGIVNSLWPDGNSQNTLELRRLWISDAVGKNAESWFLSRAMRCLPREVEAIVAFSDTSVGHYGACYQGANFLFLGQTGRSYHYVSAAGEYVHKRVPWTRASRSGLTERQQAKADSLYRIDDDEKNRYLYPLSRRARKWFAAKGLPYPKPDVAESPKRGVGREAPGFNRGEVEPHGFLDSHIALIGHVLLDDLQGRPADRGHEVRVGPQGWKPGA
jgi:hypothetical protein